MIKANSAAMKAAAKKAVTGMPTRKYQYVITTPLNYDHTVIPMEGSPDPGLTKPDMALTVPEIMRRFASGRTVNAPYWDDYSGDEDHLTGVDIRTMDISQVHDLLETSRANAARLQHEANRRAYEEKQAQYDQSVIDKWEAKRVEAAKAKEPVEPLKFIQGTLPIDGTK